MAQTRTPIFALVPVVATTGGDSWLDTLRGWLDDPTVAFLLLALGIASLMVEVANPNIVGTGLAGVTGVLLGLWSLSMQPVSTIGLALVVLAAALFLVELLSPTMGVAAALGSLALLGGGLLLIDDPVDGGVPAGVVLPTAALIGVAMVAAGRLALKVRTQPSTLTGEGLLIGREIAVKQVDDAGGHDGRTFTEGAWWQVRSTGAALVVGAAATVVAVDGLVLVVEPHSEIDQAVEGNHHD